MNILTLKTIKDSWQKSLRILDNHYVNLSLVIVLILYSSQIFGNINIIISNLYQYSFVKLLVLLIIAYVGPKDTNIAILLAISYVISLRNNKNSLIENFYGNNNLLSESDKLKYIKITKGNITGFKATITPQKCIDVINILYTNQQYKNKYFGLSEDDMKKQEYVDVFNYFMDCLMYVIEHPTDINFSKCEFALAGEYFGTQSKEINFILTINDKTKTSSRLTDAQFDYLNTISKNKPSGINSKNKQDVLSILTNSVIVNYKNIKYFGLDMSKDNSNKIYSYCFESLIFIMANPTLFLPSEYAIATEIIGIQSIKIDYKTIHEKH